MFGILRESANIVLDTQAERADKRHNFRVTTIEYRDVVDDGVAIRRPFGRQLLGTTFTINPGQPVVPLPEGNRYLGFIFAHAETAAEAEAALREAHACLHLEIEPA